MTITDVPTTATAEPTVDDFVERLVGAVLGAQEVQGVYFGHRLGWYDALADHGPMTSTQLAAATGSNERYAREWLEHQAVCGYLTVDDDTAAPQDRRFSLPAAHAEVLTDQDSLAFVAPVAHLVAAVGHHLDAIADTFRTGGGVSWAQLGDEVREAQAAANRPLFLHQLGSELLPQAGDVDERLRNGARVADIGTGFGWSAIGLARAYPTITVDGFDTDVPSIEAARRNAAAAGVADRVRFHVADGGDLATPTKPYDAVFAFECIHDLPDPVSVLATMRRLAGDDGAVVVMDENVAEAFHAPGDEVERLMYGYSLTCCLTDGMSHEHSAGTGTVMRASTFTGYARQAGFADVHVLPIEHDFFRFYRLER
ncbi:MAG TPA: class I SAM-dependent methyltransferase [Acidimicrobiales bacterium]|nr:class I SAM-dependent methyltransferase [Acidimicrobiales bacterium]